MRRIARFVLVTYLWILLLPGVVTFAGAASNQLVLIANGGAMPVLLTDDAAPHFLSPDDPIHIRMTHQTRLNALGDVFNFHAEIDSIGDLILNVGGWLAGFCPFVWGVLLARRACQS